MRRRPKTAIEGSRPHRPTVSSQARGLRTDRPMGPSQGRVAQTDRPMGPSTGLSARNPSADRFGALGSGRKASALPHPATRAHKGRRPMGSPAAPLSTRSSAGPWASRDAGRSVRAAGGRVGLGAGVSVRVLAVDPLFFFRPTAASRGEAHAELFDGREQVLGLRNHIWVDVGLGAGRDGRRNEGTLALP